MSSFLGTIFFLVLWVVISFLVGSFVFWIFKSVTAGVITGIIVFLLIAIVSNRHPTKYF